MLNKKSALFSIQEEAGQVNLSQLNGVGKEMQKCLARLNLFSLQDLLFHLPRSYQDRTTVQKIDSMRDEAAVVVEGVITNVIQKKNARTKLLCELTDGTGVLLLRFLSSLPYQTMLLKGGTRLRCYGTARLGKYGYEMIHPEFQLLKSGESLQLPEIFNANLFHHFRVKSIYSQKINGPSALLIKKPKYNS